MLEILFGDKISRIITIALIALLFISAGIVVYYRYTCGRLTSENAVMHSVNAANQLTIARLSHALRVGDEIVVRVNIINMENRTIMESAKQDVKKIIANQPDAKTWANTPVPADIVGVLVRGSGQADTVRPDKTATGTVKGNPNPDTGN